MRGREMIIVIVEDDRIYTHARWPETRLCRVNRLTRSHNNSSSHVLAEKQMEKKEKRKKIKSDGIGQERKKEKKGVQLL